MFRIAAASAAAVALVAALVACAGQAATSSAPSSVVAPDPVVITSAVDAPPKHTPPPRPPAPSSTPPPPAPEPATAGPVETNLYLYQLRALLGDPDMPAVDAIGLATYVCETAIPAGGDVEGAAEHMQRVADRPVSLLQARSVVLHAVQYRCPQSA